MTQSALIKKNKSIISFLRTVLCLGLAVVMILLSDILKSEIYDGFIFSFTTVIPTLFPFFILSDIWSSTGASGSGGILSRTFEKIFRVNGCALLSFISGLICGFPVGVKIASGLYINKRISRDELEHLIGFINNPSVAFVISGVGSGMLGSSYIGLLLYISIILSAVTVGFVFRGSKKNFEVSKDNLEQSFNIVDSIKNAGLNSLNVASCIVFFSGVLGLISGIIKNNSVITCVSMLLEVTNAVRIIASYTLLPKRLTLILIAFALGFSGFSVHLQAFSFLPPEIKRRRYFLMKLLQGLIASLLVFLFTIKRAVT